MSELNLDTVVENLKSRNVKAYVEQTGGGCATILVGEVTDGRAEVLAGPGWFSGPAWTEGRADTEDFYIGPDDDGIADPIRVGDDWDEQKVAEVISAQYVEQRAKANFARAQIDRLGQSARSALEAWEAIDGTAAADAFVAKYPKNLPDFNEVAQALTVFASEVRA